MTRRQLKALARVAVSVVLLVLLFRSVGLAEVAAEIRSARLLPLLGAVALYCVAGTWVRGRRWQTLIESLGAPITLLRTVQLFLVGTLFSQVLPTGLGGDVVRGVMLGQEGLGSARALSTVVVDRALGILSLLAVGLVAVLMAPERGGPAMTAALLAIGLLGLVGMVALFQAHRLRRRLESVPILGWVACRPGIVRFADSFAAYDRRALAQASGWGFAFALLLIPANALLGRAVGIDEATLADWSLVVPIASLSLLLPSLGGWGVREWSYVGLLALLDPPVRAHTATAVSLLFGTLNLLLAAAGGLLLLGGFVSRPGGATVDAASDTAGAVAGDPDGDA